MNKRENKKQKKAAKKEEKAREQRRKLGIDVDTDKSNGHYDAWKSDWREQGYHMATYAIKHSWEFVGLLKCS